MKRIILLVLLAAVAWFVWGKYEQRVRAERAAESAASKVPAKKSLPAAKAGETGVSFFTCDGRTACKQMTSCEEARYFVKTCPGFHSGVFGEEANCEKQWCKN